MLLLSPVFYLPLAILSLFLPLPVWSDYLLPWDQDRALCERQQPPLPPSGPTSLLVQTAHQLIRFHQEVISPVDGPRSHFRPSSSGYTYEAIAAYGLIRGYLMGCDRLLRENADPWIYPYIDTPHGRFSFDPIHKK